MTQQEGNKLIAEFDRFLFDPDATLNRVKGVFIKEGICPYSNDELKYHSSWDWLMPVVEKIEGLGFDTAICGISVGEENIIECLISPVIKNNNIEVHIKQSGEKIKILWQSIILFIQWYNTQKQNP